MFRLEPPWLRTTADPREERHATGFELYFDRFAALFVVVLWAWVLCTLYGVTLGFAVGYVALRAFLIALYARAARHLRGQGRKLCGIYIVGYSATTGLWLVSIFLPGPARYVLWCVAVLIDLAIPTRAWAALKGAAVVSSHLTERYGTFFIIVLGESVVAAVAGVAGLEFTLQSWIVAGMCFVIALCLWWIYLDLADTSVVGRGVLGLRFVYAHFPFLAGVAAFGDGTRLAITDAPHAGLGAGARWALAGGVGAFALSLALLHLGAEWTSLRDRTFAGRVWGAVLAQLLLEAFTTRTGAATVWEPPAPITLG